MTPDDSPGTMLEEAPVEPPVPAQAPVESEHVALRWVDATTVTGVAPTVDGATRRAPDLIGRAPRRSLFRGAVIVPVVTIALLAGAYSATTLLWPLHSVVPTVEAVGIEPITAPASTPAWPAVGSGAVAVAGIPSDLSSSLDASTIASITKVVTALVVLDEMPLELGESGPEYAFTASDRTRYWSYLANGESAIEVPVDGSLSQYQMLEAMLIGSGNNYADRLASNIWPTDAVFAEAANAWLGAHGLAGIEVAEPTGLDPRNIATPAALLPLAEKALANPVIAEIVAKQSTDLPGVGIVQNTNGLLADPGVVGIKTGTLDAWNLLAAKDLAIGETTVRVYSAILGQPDDDARLAATRALFAQLETELQLQPSIPARTMVGRVTTEWGEDVGVVSSDVAAVILWNAGTAEASAEFDLGDARAAGDGVGTLSVAGPLDSTAVGLELDADIEDPTAWWRLTHPLELFGLAG